MAAITAHERTLTPIDHARLSRLVSRRAAEPNAVLLGDLLLASNLVDSPCVAPDVVTMHSQVLVASEPGGVPTKYTLCYPDDAVPAAGAISVLAPIGTALLGLRAGDVARWTAPGGEPHELRVVDVPYQPEAAGEYTR